MAVDEMNAIIIFREDGTEVARKQPVEYSPTYISSIPPGNHFVDVYCWDMVAARKYFEHGSTLTYVTTYAVQKRPLKVYVYYDDGETGIDDAHVYLDSWNGQFNYWTNRAIATTNSSGRATIYAYPATLPGEKYRIRVKLGGDEIASNLFITLPDNSSGRTVSFTTNEEFVFSVSFQSSPSGAKVRRDSCVGPILGTTPCTISNLTGSSRIYLTKSGYECSSRVDVDASDAGRTLLITLTAETSTTVPAPPPPSGEDNAEIIDFTPPTGPRDRGTTATSTVTIRNSGNTTRSFYVGLSFASDTAGEWPDGWLDVPPIQSWVLNPEEEQQITIETELFWWLPEGDYTARATVGAELNNGEERQITAMLEFTEASSFELGEYAYADCKSRWIQDTVSLTIPQAQPQVYENRYTWESRLSNFEVGGPMFTIDASSDSSTGVLRIVFSIDKTEVNNVLGSLDGIYGHYTSRQGLWQADSQVFLLIPINAEFTIDSVTIDGTTLGEDIVADLLGAVPVTRGAGALAWITNKVAQQSLKGVWRATIDDLLPDNLPYTEDLGDDSKIVTLRFPSLNPFRSYDTFDSLSISLTACCEPGQHIGIFSDLKLRYKPWTLVLATSPSQEEGDEFFLGVEHRQAFDLVCTQNCSGFPSQEQGTGNQHEVDSTLLPTDSCGGNNPLLLGMALLMMVVPVNTRRRRWC